MSQCISSTTIKMKYKNKIKKPKTQKVDHFQSTVLNNV
jgi:hypothetical protein